MKQSAVIPNSHAIIMFNKRIFVVFIYPKEEWKTTTKAKFHFMNTKQKDYQTATYQYTYQDTKDNREVWFKEKKDYKRRYLPIINYINQDTIS